jgi:hypothetical protein
VRTQRICGYIGLKAKVCPGHRACGLNTTDSPHDNPPPSHELLGSPTLADDLVVVQKLAWRRRISTTAIYDRHWEAAKLEALVLVRMNSQPMKISLIGVCLAFRGQLDEICLHSVSDLRTL